jgi:hypothetical protein
MKNIVWPFALIALLLTAGGYAGISTTFSVSWLYAKQTVSNEMKSEKASLLIWQLSYDSYRLR